jgi:hypothetical protein
MWKNKEQYLIYFWQGRNSSILSLLMNLSSFILNFSLLFMFPFHLLFAIGTERERDERATND